MKYANRGTVVFDASLRNDIRDRPAQWRSYRGFRRFNEPGPLRALLRHWPGSLKSVGVTRKKTSHISLVHIFAKIDFCFQKPTLCLKKTSPFLFLWYLCQI